MFRGMFCPHFAYIPSLFRLCSVNVQSMFRLHVSSMSVNVPYVFHPCSIYVLSKFALLSLYWFVLFMFLPWGYLLRSVPCVTVWHWKIKSKILWAREKRIKFHQVYVPRMMKNIRGHLPGLLMNFGDFLKQRLCHTVTQDFSTLSYFWTKKEI